MLYHYKQYTISNRQNNNDHKQIYLTLHYPSPSILLYPTHRTISHLSNLTSITPFYSAHHTLPNSSHSTLPIPLNPTHPQYVIQYKNATKKYKREQNRTTIVNNIESNKLIVVVMVMVVSNPPTLPHLFHSTTPVALYRTTPLCTMQYKS